MLENACLNVQRLSQATLLGMTEDTDAGDFLNSMPLSRWEVLSFNPKKLEACIKINSNFDASAIQSDIDTLRIELAVETDPAKRLALDSAIRSLLTKLANAPSITISVILPTPGKTSWNY